MVATSPNPDLVGIFKQVNATTYYTPTLEMARSLLRWVRNKHQILLLVVLIQIYSLLHFSFLDPETLRDAYIKLSGVPRRCFRALRPDGLVHEMRIIQDAIDNITNIQDFAQSANGCMPFKLKTTHTLVRLEPQNAEWMDHTTCMLSHHVTGLV